MSDVLPKAALAAALAKANAEIHNPSFDKENPHFRSKFASLAAVRNALVPIYAKHGLSIIQDLQTTTEGAVACYTIILHESGEEKTFGPLIIKPTKPDAQGIGAAGTYAKRIALQGVACVVGDDDDDGEAAVGRDTGSKDIGKPRGVTTVDPRGDNRVPSDPEVVDKWVSKVADAMASQDPAAAVYAIHAELAPDDHLYIDVADAVAERGICSKGKWKELVRAGNPNQRMQRGAA